MQSQLPGRVPAKASWVQPPGPGIRYAFAVGSVAARAAGTRREYLPVGSTAAIPAADGIRDRLSIRGGGRTGTSRRDMP